LSTSAKIIFYTSKPYLKNLDAIFSFIGRLLGELFGGFDVGVSKSCLKFPNIKTVYENPSGMYRYRRISWFRWVRSAGIGMSGLLVTPILVDLEVK